MNVGGNLRDSSVNGPLAKDLVTKTEQNLLNWLVTTGASHLLQRVLILAITPMFTYYNKLRVKDY